MIVRLLPPLIAVCLLAACASFPAPPGEHAWTSGRLSVRIDASPAQAAQTMTAGFELRGDGSGGELRLNSPLGIRLAAARWAPGMAALTTPEGERQFANLDELSRQALGESLPLAALPDWLAGRPWPGAPHSAIDGGFDQLGWQVQLARRDEGYVEARRTSPPSVQMRVRLDP